MCLGNCVLQNLRSGFGDIKEFVVLNATEMLAKIAYLNISEFLFVFVCFCFCLFLFCFVNMLETINVSNNIQINI